MILMQGKGVSKGVVKGPIYFYQRRAVTVIRTDAADVEEEKRRLEEAKEKSMDQLNALAGKARKEAGDESAQLFETHAMFVEDEDFVGCMNAADFSRRRPGPLRDPPAGQEQDPGLHHPRWFGQQPHRHPGPHHGHSSDLRPGRCAEAGTQWPYSVH